MQSKIRFTGGLLLACTLIGSGTPAIAAPASTHPAVGATTPTLPPASAVSARPQPLSAPARPHDFLTAPVTSSVSRASSTAHDRTATRYVVVPGDTLADIAYRFAIAGGWPALYAANRQLIGPNPNLILVGTVLTLPSAALIPTQRPSQPAASGSHPTTRPSVTALPSQPPAPAAVPPTPPTTPSAAASTGMPHWLRLVLVLAGLLILLGFLTEPLLRRRRRQRMRSAAAGPAVGSSRPAPLAERQIPPAQAAAPVAAPSTVADAEPDAEPPSADQLRRVEAALWAAEARARAAESRARMAERHRDDLLSQARAAAGGRDAMPSGREPIAQAVEAELIERLAAAVGSPWHQVGAAALLVRQSSAEGGAAVPDARTEGRLHHLEAAAVRMRRLVDGLVTYSRLRNRPAVMRSVDSSAALMAAFEVLFARNSAQEGVVTHTEPLPTLYADPDQLAELFFHLVHNALLHVGPGRIPHVRISAQPVGRWWQFEVADNGPGIPSEDRERIFEMFTSRDPTSVHGGVGLALCRHIVAVHGGRIWVEDNPAGGSRFLFTLPADDRKSAHRVAYEAQRDTTAAGLAGQPPILTGARIGDSPLPARNQGAPDAGGVWVAETAVLDGVLLPVPAGQGCTGRRKDRPPARPRSAATPTPACPAASECIAVRSTVPITSA